MSRSAELPAGEPLGFPKCAQCPYRRAGPPWICVTCASRTLETISPRACPICSQILYGDEPCPNWLCDDPRRRIERIDAIAYLSGALQKKIHRYKYEGKTGWSLIFGRLLIGWLEAHASDDPPDLIVANPTFTRPKSNEIGHIERIIESAEIEDAEHRWPFDVYDPAAIIKTGETDKSAGRTAAEKRAAAAALRRLLKIPNPKVIRDRKILIFDDVCTTGYQLDAVADCLLKEGRAARVRGLVLARAPWRPKR